MGTPVFEALLELEGKNDVRLNWGAVGFSLRADFEGTGVVVCYGFPSHSVRGQSVTTDSANVLKKVTVGVEIVAEFKAKFLQTGVFVPAGQMQSEVKWVDKKLTNEQIKEMVQLNSDYASVIKERGLLE